MESSATCTPPLPKRTGGGLCGDRPATSARSLGESRRVHADRFDRLAKLMAEAKLFVSDVETGWICLNCGHVFTESSPAKCPLLAMTRDIYRLDCPPRQNRAICRHAQRGGSSRAAASRANQEPGCPAGGDSDSLSGSCPGGQGAVPAAGGVTPLTAGAAIRLHHPASRAERSGRGLLHAVHQPAGGAHETSWTSLVELPSPYIMICRSGPGGGGVLHHVRQGVEVHLQHMRPRPSSLGLRPSSQWPRPRQDLGRCLRASCSMEKRRAPLGLGGPLL